ncbi:hypothetical protein CANTEDRAFT_123654 [Yamadazyma tenuis ATCC 10573]|uniref:Major facilitator superfamily (MFS) profile domain-containing protein n=1 Tax=Candida tenuis (strain ATCC 10573 / BCRC 21748 / CBS 615 / JCM 9827 / NBRC 10315 / NRRL Y-1498 / VKM Y-70) TaxID=590646 RepID=G3B6A4_CANTC|nr:uncharacterized protein CANTEDRAFT_123654 [Yamadazyma tenuis ATCC 10573]EGV63421.1 hypothetical protein CANTEDRAFT_123654 [Yamadazyma tenuis ATCC 10573]
MVFVDTAAKKSGLLDSTSSSASVEDKTRIPEDLDSIHSKLAEPGYGEKGNILSQYSESQVMQMGRNYASKHNLDLDLFGRAAALARAPLQFNAMPFVTDAEKEGLHKEATRKWHVPYKLVQVIALGSMAAAVQGMDQSVINGATLYYVDQLGVSSMANPDLLEGFINGAPYLAASCIACWTSDYWNRKLGRKWVIFWTCLISGVTCVWQGFVNTWWHLFIARFCMGFGVGIKSATVPPYAAECTPRQIRGALVMLWQFFTAVGIMLGYVASLAFYTVPDRGIGEGLNWRLMVASACIPAFIVLFQIPFVPESPRWLMGNDRHGDAFESLVKLRHERIAAARDCFYQHVLLAEEHSYRGISTYKRLIEMFTIRRNRNGALGAWIVMFMQQFCGINVIAYYSSSIFVESGLGIRDSLLASWGFGMINFLFAIPAFYTIDTFGRRNLLLTTFPLMSLFLLITMCGFWIDQDTNPNGRIGLIAFGIYVYSCIYSCGEGPVPFTYSAEAFPLYIRDLGMGFATATCWFFNFILAFTWPRLRNAFTPQGAFGFYAAWNIVGFFLVLLFLPETKGLTLEELDEVFGVSLRKHAWYRLQEFSNNVNKHVLRRKVTPMEPLYEHEKRMAVTNPEWTEKTEVSHVE